MTSQAKDHFENMKELGTEYSEWVMAEAALKVLPHTFCMTTVAGILQKFLPFTVNMGKYGVVFNRRAL